MFSPFSYVAKPQYNSITVVDPDLVQYGSFGVEISISGDALYAIARAKNRKETICFNGITGALRYRFTNQSTDMGERCAVSEDGRFAAISDMYVGVGGRQNIGRVYLFNLQTGAYIRTIECPNPQNLQYMYFGSSKLVFSRDGSQLAVASSNYQYVISGYPSGYPLGAVHIFNTSNGNLIATYQPPSLIVTNLNFGSAMELSKDGTRVLIGAGHKISGQDQVGRAYLFNTTNGTLIYTFDSTNPKAYGYFANSVKLSTDNKIAIISEPYQAQGANANAGRIYVFNCDTGSLITTISNPDITKYGEFGFEILLSNDKTKLFVRATQNGSAPFSYLMMYNATNNSFIKLIPPLRTDLSPDRGYGFAESMSITTDDSRLCVSQRYFPDSDPLYSAMGGFYLYSREIL